MGLGKILKYGLFLNKILINLPIIVAASSLSEK